MEKITAMFGGFLLIIGVTFVFVPLATLMGGFVGWLVGIFFGDTILGIFGQLGIHNVTMFQLGACLGFVGGFLKTKVTAEVNGK